MNSDPRVCKIPMTEFNHLDMAAVAECELLGRQETLSQFKWQRWRQLRARRVDPDRGHNKGNAA